MSAQIDAPKYTFLKRGVYYFVTMIVAFSIQGIHAAEFTMECEEFHGGVSLIKIDKAGSSDPSVTIKLSGRAPFNPKISYADQFEIIWRDGWGGVIMNENGICPIQGKSICATEKRVNLALNESGDGKYLTVREHYIEDCCYEWQSGGPELINGKWVRSGPWVAKTLKKGNERDFDSCYLKSLVN